ncbi:FlgD immunoglobulin-like domain containing protein, partial [Hymenobacter mucosus]
RHFFRTQLGGRSSHAASYQLRTIRLLLYGYLVEPELFTPDDDGQQDFTTLTYTLDQPGYAGSVTIYDAQGRLTRRLVRNETLPTTGFWQWNGLTDQGQKAAIGYYILLVELFRASSGEKREYRKTVVVGTRF